MNSIIIKELQRTILMLQVHPHNKENSEFEDRINILSRLVQNLKIEQKWQSFEDEKPICFESGLWDGLKSEPFLCRSKGSDKIFIAVAYEGKLDGTQFFDIYDNNSESLIIDNDLEWHLLFC